MSSPSTVSEHPQNSSKDLISQYELGDDAPVTETVAEQANPPAVDASLTAAPPAGETQPEAPRPTPPRDPETGKFLPRSEAPPVHQHSPRMQRMAIKLGVSEEEIASTPPEHLEEIVYHLTSQLATLRDERSQEASRESRATDHLPEQPAQTPEPVEDELTYEEGAFDPTIEKFMKVVVGLKDQTREIKELKALVGQLVQNEHVRIRQTVGQRIDSVFEALGADYEPYLGKGRGQDMRPDEPALQRRKAVLAMVEMDKSKASLEDKIKRVSQTLYGVRGAPSEQVEQPARRNGYTTDEWNAGGLQRPTHRANSAEPPGEEKAKKNVERWQRENSQTGPGIGVDDFLG